MPLSFPSVESRMTTPTSLRCMLTPTGWHRRLSEESEFWYNSGGAVRNYAGATLDIPDIITFVNNSGVRICFLSAVYIAFYSQYTLVTMCFPFCVSICVCHMVSIWYICLILSYTIRKDNRGRLTVYRKKIDYDFVDYQSLCLRNAEQNACIAHFLSISNQTRTWSACDRGSLSVNRSSL